MSMILNENNCELVRKNLRCHVYYNICVRVRDVYKKDKDKDKDLHDLLHKGFRVLRDTYVCLWILTNQSILSSN